MIFFISGILFFDFLLKLKKNNKQFLYQILAGIFFGLANSKKFKSKINLTMKDNDIKMLQSIFIDFIKQEQIAIYK